MLRDHFLTEQQIEELDLYGKIDLDDATMDRLLKWAGCTHITECEPAPQSDSFVVF